MIIHSQKAIFLHIGKTAGTSIERWLFDKKLDPNIYNREFMFGYDREEGIYLQHASAETVQRLSSDEVFTKYYKFSVVRNPFVRSISVYHYLKQQHDKQFGNFENYVKNLPELAKKPHNLKGSHHIAQINYTHIDSQCICNHIAYFESLPEALDPVRSALGIKTHLEKHNHRRFFQWGDRPVPEYFTQGMTTVIQDVYQEDFENYGYSINPDDFDLLPNLT